MSQKLSKGKVRRCPPPGSPEFVKWRAKVATGMRKGRQKRRAAGLLSLVEVSVKYVLPLCFVRRAADTGALPVVQAGSRRYVRAEEAERVFGVPRTTPKRRRAA